MVRPTATISIMGDGEAVFNMQEDLLTALIAKAIVFNEVVSITYTDEPGQITTRFIEPRGLRLSRNGMYVLAWCSMRDDVRSFRLDRIKAISSKGAEGFNPFRFEVHIPTEEETSARVTDNQIPA